MIELKVVEPLYQHGILRVDEPVLVEFNVVHDVIKLDIYRNIETGDGDVPIGKYDGAHPDKSFFVPSVVPPQTYVVSSNLESIAYDPKTWKLYVTFKNSGVYVYDHVPQNVYDGLTASESKGKAMAAIKKTYPVTKLQLSPTVEQLVLESSRP